MLKYFKVLSIFYRRNLAKNTMLVIFLFITNLTMSVFLILFESSSVIMPTLEESYFEKLSVNVSRYTTINTNNELINVKTYAKPSLTFMENVMDYTGQFIVRPDYSMFFSEATLKIFDKPLVTPLFITYGSLSQGIGINEAFYKEITKEVKLDDRRPLELEYSLRKQFIVSDEEELVEQSDTLVVDFIYNEPSYFSVPKVYIPQNYIDRTLGSHILKNKETLNNYLLNSNSDSELSNLSVRCHFINAQQYTLFTEVISSDNNATSGYEISAEHLVKVASFKALYDYINILITILFIFTFTATVVISIIIAHTSLLANLRQMALLNILGAKKSDLYVLYLLLLIFNYSLGLLSISILPFMLPLLNHTFYMFFRLNVALFINKAFLIYLVCGNFLFLVLTLTIIFMFNMRRPLLYLLIDA